MTPETDSIEWLDLDTGEEIRWAGRPGAYPLVPFLVIGVGIGLFGLFLAAILTSPSSPFRFVLIGLFIGLGLFVAGWRSAEHRSVAYAITTNAVYEKRGSAAADVSRTPLDAVESASVEQSALAGMFDRGTVRCYAPTADRTTLTLEGISRPRDVHALLTDRRGTTTLDSSVDGTDSDRSNAAENTVSAYVVDATDQVVLLRAFTDGSTADLARGRRVSLTLRSDLDYPSSESRKGPATDSFDREGALEPGRGADTDAALEPSENRRSDPEGTVESDGTDEGAEDQFVWGSTSAGDGTAVDDGEGPETDRDVPDGSTVGTGSDRDVDDRS